MIFIEPLFLFAFLPLTVCAFYGVGALTRNTTATLAILVLASGIFYAPYGRLAGSLLVFSICLNLVCGEALAAPRVTSQAGRRIILTTALVFNFAALAVFKYVDQIFSLAYPSTSPILGIVIPAGISFYTFHQSVFLLDSYNRRVEVLQFLDRKRSFAGHLSLVIRYAVFVGLFPQLVIGPITFISQLGHQLRSSRLCKLRLVNIQVGATLVVIGLFKKVCIADPIGGVINPIYDSLGMGAPIPWKYAALAIVGYSFQLYFDFSGYSDMALGIARLFGLRLPFNFDSPLRATGLVDFYRRWHITLTRAITLFVFTPLSLWGNRLVVRCRYKGLRRKLLSSWLPLVANFEIIALWHGAFWTFVFYGMAHGLWYVIETEIRASAAFKAFRAKSSDRFRLIAGILVTTVLLMPSLALFRSQSVDAFLDLMRTLAGFDGGAHVDGYVNRRIWLGYLAAAGVIYLLPNSCELLRNYRPGIVTFVNSSTTPRILRVAWRPNLLWAVFIAALAIASFANLNLPIPFLYAGF